MGYFKLETIEPVRGGMQTNTSVSCMVCRRLLASQGGGGEFLCVYCVEALRLRLVRDGVARMSMELRAAEAKAAPVGAVDPPTVPLAPPTLVARCACGKEIPHDRVMCDVCSPKPRATTDGKPPETGWEHGPAPAPIDETGQHKAYWVLPESERAKGFIRPVRRTYKHVGPCSEGRQPCGSVTTMSQVIAETYARDPKYYGATFCANCRGHYPVGEHGEFVWEPATDGSRVGT
jgi:hypothetical protein